MRLYKTMGEALLPTIVELNLQDDVATGESNVIVEMECASEDGKVVPIGSPNTCRPWDPDYRTLLGVLERAQEGQPSHVTLAGASVHYERWDPAWRHHASDEPEDEWYVVTDRGQSSVLAGPHGLTLRLPRYAVWIVQKGVLAEALETGDDLGLLQRMYDVFEAPLILADAAPVATAPNLDTAA